jgi:hypothetical protein
MGVALVCIIPSCHTFTATRTSAVGVIASGCHAPRGMLALAASHEHGGGGVTYQPARRPSLTIYVIVNGEAIG